ncbi:RluA family pseudouridine synthase [Pelagibius litoralis]|uniref:Pseudouridine synthase n=1 Tax=Pelagibius litoralis TaxID=374515 RepID=A0A967EZT3_9PROT|nr:RluA family pseudouridine synthase [Pelagibius litoralis]NIA70466.1 RluA family pseudouridine synthase [Pelagibius litoralis]
MAGQKGQERHEVTVAEGPAGRRLDRVLADALPQFSRNRIKALIDGGLVSLDGTAVTSAAAKVKVGQTFAIIIPEVVEAAPVAQAIPLDIVFEDEDLIVLNKPAGLVVHPAPGNPDHTLVNALIAHCGESLTGIGGERRPGIVHRLDKDTSGLMVAAKSAAAHRGLVEQFAARSIERSYRGLVWGRPSPTRGSLSGNIGRSPRNRKKMAVLKRGGRPAETGYQVLRSFRNGAVSEVECRLKTGRTHQIRVHMTEAGHGLLGDPVYGRGSSKRIGSLPAGAQTALAALARQALHAKSLGFHHPVKHGVLQFDSQLPHDMCELINCLE